MVDQNCTRNESICWPKHLSNQLQGVVTYMSPVEAFPTGIKIFGWHKGCFITWLSLLKLLIAWFFTGQMLKWRRVFLIFWFSQFGGHLGFDLIAWFNFEPGHERFYTGHKWLYTPWVMQHCEYHFYYFHHKFSRKVSHRAVATLSGNTLHYFGV